ncbi:MAG: hypothetical protein ABI134_13625 [Byssovorax sp.]
MKQRRRVEGEPAAPWCVGLGRFQVDASVAGTTLVVGVRCRFGSLDSDHVALLDTGAHWSIVGGEMAQLLEDEAGESIEIAAMATRLGIIRGRLHRLIVTLAADEGDDLDVPTTLLLAPSWSGPPVLGYRGFLDRVRFGLDPGNGPDDQWMFFGGAGE